jgi:hypothetical protein
MIYHDIACNQDATAIEIQLLACIVLLFWFILFKVAQAIKRKSARDVGSIQAGGERGNAHNHSIANCDPVAYHQPAASGLFRFKNYFVEEGRWRITNTVPN